MMKIGGSGPLINPGLSGGREMASTGHKEGEMDGHHPHAHHCDSGSDLLGSLPPSPQRAPDGQSPGPAWQAPRWRSPDVADGPNQVMLAQDKEGDLGPGLSLPGPDQEGKQAGIREAWAASGHLPTARGTRPAVIPGCFTHAAPGPGVWTPPRASLWAA